MSHLDEKKLDKELGEFDDYVRRCEDGFVEKEVLPILLSDKSSLNDRLVAISSIQSASPFSPENYFKRQEVLDVVALCLKESANTDKPLPYVCQAACIAYARFEDKELSWLRPLLKNKYINRQIACDMGNLFFNSGFNKRPDLTEETLDFLLEVQKHFHQNKDELDWMDEADGSPSGRKPSEIWTYLGIKGLSFILTGYEYSYQKCLDLIAENRKSSVMSDYGQLWNNYTFGRETPKTDYEKLMYGNFVQNPWHKKTFDIVQDLWEKEKSEKRGQIG